MSVAGRLKVKIVFTMCFWLKAEEFKTEVHCIMSDQLLIAYCLLFVTVYTSLLVFLSALTRLLNCDIYANSQP